MGEKAKKGIGFAMVPILSIFALEKEASGGGVNAGLSTMAMAFLKLAFIGTLFR